MKGILASIQIGMITTKISKSNILDYRLSWVKNQVTCHSSTENTLRPAYNVIKLPDLTVQY